MAVELGTTKSSSARLFPNELFPPESPAILFVLSPPRMPQKVLAHVVLPENFEVAAGVTYKLN